MKKFVFCFQIEKDVPLEKGESCCDFYSDKSHRCEYHKYSISSRRIKNISKLSERDQLLEDNYDE